MAAYTNSRQAQSPSRTRRSATQWQALIDNFETSPLSLTDYCKRNAIASSGFYYWKKRLSQHAHTPAPKQPKPFIELIAPNFATQQLTNAETGGWRMELELGHGMILRVR
jgi:hypothetical protein